MKSLNIWKSNWIADSSLYKRFIYEDEFLRRYFTSFFFKWSKASRNRILGSIYIFRTYGKLYLYVLFFNNTGTISKVQKKKVLKKKYVFNHEVKPLVKCKKHLVAFLFFYNIERLLGVQLFFKFQNICAFNNHSENKLIERIVNTLIIKLAYLKHQVSSGIYLSTLSILVHIFKFCKPDSLLLANFIAHIFKSFHKHARFLLFLKKVLLHIYNIFQFTGVKILITGKLNGFSRAQSKQLQIGQISLQTYDLPVYYGAADAFTRAGKIGIKVWIC